MITSRFLPYALLPLLVLAACGQEAPPAPLNASAEPVLTLDALEQGKVFVPSAYEMFAGLRLDQLGPVRYRQGDDPAWKQRDYDDSSWHILDDPHALSFDCGEVHWFRVPYTVDSSLAGKPLHMNIFAPGAVEVYLNGHYLHHYGAIAYEAGRLEVRLPPMSPRRQIRFTFPAGQSGGVLAFRYAICPPVASRPGYVPLESPIPEILLTPLHQADPIKVHEDQTMVLFGIFSGSSFLIFLLTLILYLYNRRDRGWIFISLSALFTFLVAFTHLLHKGMIGVTYGTLQLATVVNMLAYPLSLYFIALSVMSVFNRLQRHAWLPITIVVGISVFTRFGAFFFLPPEINEVFDLVVLFAVFITVSRLTVRAVRDRLYGRWILGTGVTIFFLFGIFLDRFYTYTDPTRMPWELRTVMRISFYLAMPTTITIYLAVKSAENGRLAARRRDELDAEVRRRTAELELEKEKSEQLLLNILPHQVARELKEKGRSEAREFDLVTVLFADFIDFTQQASNLPAKELLAELNDCFRAFDDIADQYCVEKIKTIGDAYMAAGGLGIPCTIEPADVVLAALEMQAFMRRRLQERMERGLPGFAMRVGIHSGPVVAGIVGVKKFQYDIWGDTVNIASRMESAGAVGRVNISQATYDLLVSDPRFVFQPRGLCAVKGKGDMMMYFVERPTEWTGAF